VVARQGQSAAAALLAMSTSSPRTRSRPPRWRTLPAARARRKQRSLTPDVSRCGPALTASPHFARQRENSEALERKACIKTGEALRQNRASPRFSPPCFAFIPRSEAIDGSSFASGSHGAIVATLAYFRSALRWR